MQTPQQAVPWLLVFEAYAAEARLAPSTIKRWTGVLVALDDAMGTDDLARITRNDLIAWKSGLLGSGRDPRTVRDAYVAAVKAVMNWAGANVKGGPIPGRCGGVKPGQWRPAA